MTLITVNMTLITGDVNSLIQQLEKYCLPWNNSRWGEAQGVSLGIGKLKTVHLITNNQ